jgi:hypothetical protein
MLLVLSQSSIFFWNSGETVPKLSDENIPSLASLESIKKNDTWYLNKF